MSAQAVAGEMAELLAARLEEHGYRVMFPPGQPPAGQPAGPDQVATALLAHLAVLDGRSDRKDAPR